MKIVAAKSILKANDQLAGENRNGFNARGLFCVNLVGSPGCGKTTLLESLFAAFDKCVSAAVIEGDIAGQVDAERMEKIGVPVVQINTEGMCHLDANMIAVAAQDVAAPGVNMLWMMDPGDRQGLEPLAELLGMRFQDGIIVDNNTNLRNTLRIQHPAMIPVLDYQAHPVTENIEYNTLFPISRGVEQTNNTFVGTIIAQSLPLSWSEASALGSDIVYEPDNGDIEGPVGIVLALEREITNENSKEAASQRIIISGDSDFIANSYIGAGANLSLGLNIFNWLAGDDDLIAIDPRSAPDTQLELDDTEVMMIGLGYFIVLPAGLILTGIVIWLRRRNR